MFDAPCDVAFLCAKPEELKPEDVERLAANGCKTVVDGAYRPVSSAAAKVRRSPPFRSRKRQKNMLEGTQLHKGSLVIPSVAAAQGLVVMTAVVDNARSHCVTLIDPPVRYQTPPNQVQIVVDTSGTH